MIRRLRWAAGTLCIGIALSACGEAPAENTAPAVSAPVQTHNAGTVSPTAAPQPIEILLPEASGTVVYGENGVSLDASNTHMGYIMVRAEEQEARLKLRISSGEMTYTYDLAGGEDYVAFPLQQGDGPYQVRVLRHAYDDLYEPIFEQSITVALESAFAPFLMPSQYVNYTAENEAVRRSFALAGGQADDAAKAEVLYRFVADTIEYDYEKAAAVEAGSLTGYLPDVDATLHDCKGICFDYSALLAAMLRVQGIPTQLVIGQVEPEGIVHAWNLVYLDNAWERMDATFDDDKRKDGDYMAQRIY